MWANSGYESGTKEIHRSEEEEEEEGLDFICSRLHHHDEFNKHQKKYRSPQQYTQCNRKRKIQFSFYKPLMFYAAL